MIMREHKIKASKFWQEGIAFIYLFLPIFLIFIVVLVALTIYGIILTIQAVSFNNLGIVLIGTLCLLMCIIYSIQKRDLMSVVILSEIGIKTTCFNKEIYSIKWDEIQNINTTYQGKFKNYLTFYSSNQIIKVCYSKNLYNTIMDICPNTAVKNMLNTIDITK